MTAEPSLCAQPQRLTRAIVACGAVFVNFFHDCEQLMETVMGHEQTHAFSDFDKVCKRQDAGELLMMVYSMSTQGRGGRSRRRGAAHGGHAARRGGRGHERRRPRRRGGALCGRAHEDCRTVIAAPLHDQLAGFDTLCETPAYLPTCLAR